VNIAFDFSGSPSIPSLPTLKPILKIMKNKQKEFIKLKRRYLNLRYRITKNRLACDDPPDEMLKEYADIERTLRIISKLPDNFLIDHGRLIISL
jgi:hypothetical protein